MLIYTRVFIFLNTIDNHNNNNDDYNHIAHITITATTIIITTVMTSSPSPLLPPTENKMLHEHQNLVITTVQM